MNKYIVYGEKKPVKVTADRYEVRRGAYESQEVHFYRRLNPPTRWQQEEEVRVVTGYRLTVHQYR